MSMFRDKVSLAGWVVIGLALVSFLQVLWITYSNRIQTECQNNLNSQLVGITKQRAAISDQDREAIRTLVITVFTVGQPEQPGGEPPTPEEQQAKALAAYRDYVETNKRLDDLRAALIFPDPSECYN